MIEVAIGVAQGLALSLPVGFIVLALLARPPFRPFERLPHARGSAGEAGRPNGAEKGRRP
jgi:hypothetical protein